MDENLNWEEHIADINKSLIKKLILTPLKQSSIIPELDLDQACLL